MLLLLQFGDVQVRGVTIVLAVIDVAPHLAARKTHQRSLEF
jgi:hypothetical protein